MVERFVAVAFDLDGTLIDSTRAIVESFHYAADKLGCARAPETAIVPSIGHLLEDQFRMFWPDLDPHMCARIFRENYARIACEKTALLPGAREILDTCAVLGLKTALATSKKLRYAEMILEHLGVLAYFSARIGPDEVTNAKPHPETILKCSKVLDVAPADLVVVGDTEFDVRAAHAAGARCLCVTTGYDTRTTLEALQPEAVFDTLEGVSSYIASACRR